MHALTGTSFAAGMPTLPAAPITAPTPASTTTTSDDSAGSGGGDLLSAMNPAMDAAFAIGRPTDASGAAGILATTGSYIKGANATIDKLDTGIERRQKQLADLQVSDPEAAQHMQTQIDLLQRLRDRIQLSIERVSETIAGSSDGGIDGDDRLRKRREEVGDQPVQPQLAGVGAPHQPGESGRDRDDVGEGDPKEGRAFTHWRRVERWRITR